MYWFQPSPVLVILRKTSEPKKVLKFLAYVSLAPQRVSPKISTFMMAKVLGRVFSMVCSLSVMRLHSPEEH